MTLPKNKLDDLDRNIILELQEDARRSYKEIARKFKVAESTISNRVNRMLKNDILKLQARVNPFQIENKIAAIIGIKLRRRGHQKVVDEILKIPGVTSVYVATGEYDLFVELMTDSIEKLNEFLFDRGLDRIENVTATETFLLLASTTKFFKLY
jgi:Lrp/AsnC family transcriptional regulator for asnA, asnC and gidA